MGVKPHHTPFAPWAAMAAAIAAEILHHQVLSDMLRYDCRLGGPGPGLVGAGVALALVGLGAWVSWSHAPANDNGRFIVRLGLLFAAVVAIAIAWQTLATLMVPPCPT